MLHAQGLVVEYPGVRALDGVDFDLRPGEIHALLGENGAGKSTLVRVLCGLKRPSQGTITLSGVPFAPRNPVQAQHRGISVVHQEVDLIPSLSVAENLTLGREPRLAGFIRPRARLRLARQALARLNLSIDPSTPLGLLPLATQQMVAICRAIDCRARILILDEPTSSLDRRETDELFRILRAARASGLAILLITHFLGQVYELADRITVLRNGRRVGVWPTADLPPAALIHAMTGRTFDAPSPTPETKSPPTAADVSAPLLRVRNLARRNVFEPASFDLHPGEALGLAGLLGSGRTELAELLFGIRTPDSADLALADQPFTPGSIPAAIKAGLAMTPEDRKAGGIIPDLSIRENIALALQARQGILRPLSRACQEQLADEYIRALGIRTPSAETPIRALSGGNQQKVVLARWLATHPKVFILDEPTRGIDVGARSEIEALLARLQRDGLGLIVISSELDELVRVCGRVLLLRDRSVIGELTAPHLTVDSMLQRISAGATA